MLAQLPRETPQAPLNRVRLEAERELLLELLRELALEADRLPHLGSLVVPVEPECLAKLARLALVHPHDDSALVPLSTFKVVDV